MNVALSLLTLALAAPVPERPAWLGDYQAARKAARENGKPIFVVFRCEH